MPDHLPLSAHAAALLDRIAAGTARAGLPVLGFDVAEARVAEVDAGARLVSPIPTEALRAARAGRFEAVVDSRTVMARAGVRGAHVVRA